MPMNEEARLYHLEQLADKRVQLENWLQQHTGQQFAITSLAETLGIGDKVLRTLIASCSSWVEVAEENLKGVKYLSVAPPLEPTPEGVLEEVSQRLRKLDKLGEQAREDLNYTIYERPRKSKTRVNHGSDWVSEASLY